MTDLTTLADRVEAGTVEMQRELLEAARTEIHRARGVLFGWLGQQYRDWDARLECGAYVDAAMMLVPEGCFLRFYGEGVQAIVVRPFSGSWREVSRAFGVVTGAVIAAACLRAHATKDHPHE